MDYPTQPNRKTANSTRPRLAKHVAVLLVPIALVVLAVYLVAGNVVEPAVSVRARALPSGDYELEIDPNWIVHHIGHVTVHTTSGVVAAQDQPRSGLQRLILPGTSLTSDTVVRVELDLLYDRSWAPSLARVSRLVTLP